MSLLKITSKSVRTVTVLKGGWSAERDVSLNSGTACARALRESGYEVTEIDVTRDLELLIKSLQNTPDVIFNALHGTGGEDGCMQGLLDMLGLRYTHSGRLASALAMDKSRAKSCVGDAGVRVPQGAVIALEDFNENTLPFSAPYVIKPNREGSSVGVYIIKPGDNRWEDLRKNWNFGEALVEEFIPGRELTVAVAGNPGEKTMPFTVTEITANTAFYDYEAKYAPGGSNHILPADVPADIFNTALDWAVKAHEALGCAGVSRTDFRYDDTQTGINGLYYLETNTQPGMTSTSLVPEQAYYIGISFPELVTWMVEHAC